MNLVAIKTRSESILVGKGFPINVSLPPLDELQLRRSLRETQDRCLALHCVVALACRVAVQSVKSQLDANDLAKSLSPREKRFVGVCDTDQAAEFRLQEEGLLALVWALGLQVNFDPFGYCDESLARALPSSKLGRSVAQFRSESALRPRTDLISMLDLHYRMDWGFASRHAEAARASGVQAYVVRERRRALEWLFCEEHWDEVTLDT